MSDVSGEYQEGLWAELQEIKRSREVLEKVSWAETGNPVTSQSTSPLCRNKQ